MRASSSSHPAADAVELPSAAPRPETVPLVLEITRGRTRFRSRPVASPRFLIGAGVTCDLRLGGSDIPVLHSIITLVKGEVHLEAIAPNPVLIVNGRGIREIELSDGDVIGIGNIELRARLAANRPPAHSDAAEVTAAVIEEENVPLAELSASELIDRIEAEERLVDDFEGRRLLGAEALLQSVFSRAGRSAAAGTHEAAGRSPIPAPHFLSKRPQVLAARSRHGASAKSADREGAFLNELEELGRQLTELSLELRSNSRRSSARDRQYIDATELLMQTQGKLASQLETLVSQVSGMQRQPAPKPRAIA